MIDDLDWIDIILHLLIGVVATVAVCWYGRFIIGDWIGWIAISINFFVWPLREAWQSWRGGHSEWWRPWLWSLQKSMEAWPPAFLGSITGYVVLTIGG